MTDTHSTPSTGARPESLSSALVQLAEAEIILRDSRDAHGWAKAQAEHAAIVANGGTYGTNPDDRARFLTLALAESTEYQRSLEFLRTDEARVSMLKAYVDSMRYELRERELQANLAVAR